MIWVSLSGIEMLIVNLLVGFACLRRKYSITVMLASFLFLALIKEMFCSEFVEHYRDNRWGPLFSLFFLLPTCLLYSNRLTKKLLVFFTIWIHLFTIENIAEFVPHLYADKIAAIESFRFILQSVLLVIIVPLIIKFIKTEFVFLVNNMSKKYFNYLVLNTILWFALLFTAKYVLLAHPAHPVNIILFILLAATIMMVHPLVFTLAKDSIIVAQLEQAANTDSLTHVGSRNKFYIDCEEMISRFDLFSLIYLDLDQFKSINDRFGHQTGDRYLKLFSRSIEQLLASNGKLYRLAGDEFVIICDDRNAESISKLIQAHHWQEFCKDFPEGFMGVSLGQATFLQDGHSIDRLLHLADQAMYQNKKLVKMSGMVQNCL